MSGGVGGLCLAAVEEHLTGPLCDLHALRLSRREVILPGENHPDGLMLAGRGNDGVGDDPALEVEVRLSVDGDVDEFHDTLIGSHQFFCKCKG